VEFSVLIVVVIILAPILLIAVYKYRRDWEQTRQLYGPQTEPDDTVYYEGVGEETTRPFWLRAGRYQVNYLFSENTLVKVDLLRTADGERETLVVKTGQGVAEFEVPEAARCRLVIEPAAPDAEWEVEISPLMLPSRRPTNATPAE
jgi:hypothetical protein